MDRAGANYARVAAQLKEKLGHHPVMLQIPIGAEDRFQGIVDPIVGKAYYFDGENGENVREEEIPAELVEAAKQARHDIIEGVANVDDHLAELFVDDKPVSNEELKAAIRRATLALKMTPVMCGSAYKNKGVQLLLDGVSRLPAQPDRGGQRGARPEEQRGEGRARVDPGQAVRRPGLQARGRALRSADLHAHLPGAASPRATSSSTSRTRRR